MLFSRYRGEMRKLRILAEEFVEKHPKAAHLFGGPSTDPDVERLLEGTAFLSALLRGRLEDDWPEVIHPLIRRVQPRWLRGTPAATIVAFTPGRSAKEPLVIPKGARVSSVPIDGTRCHFATCSETVVHPVILLDAGLTHPPGQPPAISLELGLSCSLADWKVATLPLYLGGEFSKAADLYLLLSRYLDQVLICASDAPSCPVSLSFPTNTGECAPFLPGLPSSDSGLGALLDYFACPERFLFVDVAGLDRWRERGSGTRFTLTFILKSSLPVPEPVIDLNSFILSATPAVNLFAHLAEPIRVNNTDSYRVVPSGRDSEFCRVWSVDAVTGFVKSSAARKRLYLESLSLNDDADAVARYRTTCALRQLGGGTDVLVKVHRPDEADEVLILDITCTNGDKPHRLGLGDVSVCSADIPEGVAVRNVIPVTPPTDPPLEPDRLWKLYSATRPPTMLLSQPHALRSVLESLAASVCREGEVLAKAMARIDGIEDVRVKEKDMLRGGELWRGIEVVMRLDVGAYSCLGDLYLFASAVERYLGGFMSEHYLVRFAVEDGAGAYKYQWDEKRQRPRGNCRDFSVERLTVVETGDRL